MAHGFHLLTLTIIKATFERSVTQLQTKYEEIVNG